ncbi:MAG: hypothetical protein ACM3XS_04720 [Bacteroidota bacterium]
MRKGRASFLWLFLLLLLPAAPAGADDGPAFTFRRTFWGMSAVEVKEGEEGDPVGESDEMLVYRGKVIDLEGDIVYRFAGGKLIAASYLFFLEPTQCTTTFYYLKELLSTKYGRPNLEGGWDEILVAGWETAATRVVLLYGGRQAGSLRLTYVARQAAAAFAEEI